MIKTILPSPKTPTICSAAHPPSITFPPNTTLPLLFSVRQPQQPPLRFHSITTTFMNPTTTTETEEAPVLLHLLRSPIFFFDVNTDRFEEALDRFAQLFTKPLMSDDATGSTDSTAQGSMTGPEHEASIGGNNKKFLRTI
ncbi:unnamed protein product [Vicia faba]|uniref:Uncharacterized protein n=1 Tax=Vicia faba TaxID=3906 RepID=A0AAV1AEU5_VICFA|nr:unnamed protein product [Vicia faba]